jgi:hypothetical protein
VLISNVLDSFDLVDPAWILDKGKLHILTHLPEDVECFGPAIRYATEVFECFNHIFHMCSVLSNHQAPGHDLTCKCSSLEHIEHILSGEYWKEADGTWTQASPRVCSILPTHLIVQTHLGWVPLANKVPGETKLNCSSCQVMLRTLAQRLYWGPRALRSRAGSRRKGLGFSLCAVPS